MYSAVRYFVNEKIFKLSENVPGYSDGILLTIALINENVNNVIDVYHNICR